ncbi:Protein saf4 [Elasticomyces elasticus]|nr:Protein saf4 [Elasticomyces elasticus]
MQGFGMGRYVPPEHEGSISANKLAGKHALGARARKIKDGILTVRFEMPFAVWCSHCPKPTIIGQGVRFNAEKKKVGKYHSTPVWAFRMKHAACGGCIEVRTDPKNTAYVVCEGGKKRDTGEDKVVSGDEGRELLTPEERERRREDAFAMLEGKQAEKELGKVNKVRIEELLDWRERSWQDPDERNRRLRGAFRIGRKSRKVEAERTERLQEKMCLGMDLLPETEEDATRASLVEFGMGSNADGAALKATSRPLFQYSTQAISKTPSTTTPKRIAKTKAATLLDQRRKALKQQLVCNTRAALDPFLTNKKTSPANSATNAIFSCLKRKRPTESTCDNVGGDGEGLQQLGGSLGAHGKPALPLVDYDSD